MRFSHALSGKNPAMISLACHLLYALIAATAVDGAHAQPSDRIVFATDWLAQAEHGG
jgi:hypothetical protein